MRKSESLYVLDKGNYLVNLILVEERNHFTEKRVNSLISRAIRKSKLSQNRVKSPISLTKNALREAFFRGNK